MKANWHERTTAKFAHLNQYDQAKYTYDLFRALAEDLIACRAEESSVVIGLISAAVIEARHRDGPEAAANWLRDIADGVEHDSGWEQVITRRFPKVGHA